jgi:dihydrofolate synthase/folylpolyglutamate synthase
VVLDVAHNPHAAERLRDSLAQMGGFVATYAVFAMLRDKDIAGVARLLAPLVDAWVIAPLPGTRGTTVHALHAELAAVGIRVPVHTASSVADAYRYARGVARPDDRIVVFGSFHTVGDVLALANGLGRL